MPPRLAEAQLRKNRTNMTAIHFLLTYPRWSVSLFLVLASLSLRLPSMDEAVYQPMADLKYLTGDESSRYVECVSDTFERLSRQLSFAAQKQAEESNAIRARNRQQIEAVASRADACGNATVSARRALQAWQLEQPIPTVNDTELCSLMDSQTLQALLEQGPESVMLVQSQAANALDAYLAESTATLERMADYAKARATYDYNYFVGVKIQGCIDLLDSFPGLNITLPQPVQLMQNLTLSLHGILDAFDDLAVRVNVLTGRLGEFQVSIQGFYSNYKDIYNRLTIASVFVRDFLPSGIALPPSLDLSGIPLGDSLLPPVFELPDFPKIDMDALISMSLEGTVSMIEQLLNDFAGAVGDQLMAALKDLQLELRDLLSLDDYNPPQYVGARGDVETLSDEVDILRGLGQAVRQKVLSTWNDESGRKNVSTIDQTMNLDWNSSSPDLMDGESSAPFKYIEPLFPLLQIPKFVSVFLQWVWIAELVLQLVRLLRLRRMYKQEVTIKLPEINYLDDDENIEEAEAHQQSRMAVIQLFVFKQLFNPWTFVVAILLPLTILGISLWLPHVVHSCIKSHEGTVIARGLVAPLMINNASFAGAALHASAQYVCHQNQRRICREKYSEIELLYRQDVAELATANQRLLSASSASGVMSRCLDTELLDYQFGIHCCGLEGYGSRCSPDQVERYCPIDELALPPSSFRPVGDYLGSDVCSNASTFDAIILEDSRFDCTVLRGVCDRVPCGGVDEALLQQLSVESDCRVQVHLLKCCVLVALSLYHAALLNLCASMAFCGVQRLRWRTLRPSGIELRTYLNASGELVKGGDPSDRLKRVAASMQRFEAIGKLQVAFSVGLLAVWLVSFIVLGNLLSDLNNA
jgi:hypothetical protein